MLLQPWNRVGWSGASFALVLMLLIVHLLPTIFVSASSNARELSGRGVHAVVSVIVLSYCLGVVAEVVVVVVVVLAATLAPRATLLPISPRAEVSSPPPMPGLLLLLPHPLLLPLLPPLFVCESGVSELSSSITSIVISAERAYLLGGGGPSGGGG